MIAICNARGDSSPSLCSGPARPRLDHPNEWRNPPVRFSALAERVASLIHPLPPGVSRTSPPDRLEGSGCCRFRPCNHSKISEIGPLSHEMAGIRGQELGCGRLVTSRQGGADMQTLTGVKLFARAKRARKSKDWFERAKLVVAAARERAAETTQQRAGQLSTLRRPTVWQ